MKSLLFLFLLIPILSCKNDGKTTDQVTPADMYLKPDNSPATDPTKLKIPNACEMVTEAQLQAILNITGTVNIKEANDPGNVNAKSCFYKWDDLATPNAGILIQIMTNPVYSEFPDYVSKFVAAKLTEGETVLGSDTPSTYKKFEAGGIVGSYSFDQSRFYWSLGNDFLFMLALNVTTLDEPKMVKAAEKIIEEVNKTFATKVTK
ncbi:MAG: hypothetical protein H7X99_05815 [Saprospiraceae bacterium]|nr:hypothetical protein [Saprospiraceae bacterium]